MTIMHAPTWNAPWYIDRAVIDENYMTRREITIGIVRNIHFMESRQKTMITLYVITAKYGDYWAYFRDDHGNHHSTAKIAIMWRLHNQYVMIKSRVMHDIAKALEGLHHESVIISPGQSILLRCLYFNI